MKASASCQVGHYFGRVDPELYRMCFPLALTRWIHTKLLGRPFFVFDGCAQVPLPRPQPTMGQYLSAPWCAQLAARASPGAGLVVNVREPVAQNISWWHFELESVRLGEALGHTGEFVHGREIAGSLDEALHRSQGKEAQRLWSEASYEMVRRNVWRLPSWAGTWPGGQLSGLTRLGCYVDDIERWCAEFGRDRLAVVELSELNNGIDQVLERMNALLPLAARADRATLKRMCEQARPGG